MVCTRALLPFPGVCKHLWHGGYRSQRGLSGSHLTHPLPPFTCAPPPQASPPCFPPWAAHTEAIQLPASLHAAGVCKQPGKAEVLSRKSPPNLASSPPVRFGWLVPEPPTAPLHMHTPSQGKAYHFPLRAAHMSAIWLPTSFHATGAHKCLGRAAVLMCKPAKACQLPASETWLAHA